MSDPVAEFLAREDGAFDDDIDVGIQEPPAPVQPEIDALPVQQNGIHREGGDSGVDLAAQDIPDLSPSAPLSNGHTSRQANSTPPVREEHETIKRWREEQAKRLQEKDEAESKQKQAMRKEAETELKKWKEQHVKEVAERKKKNREVEQKIQKDTKSPTKGDSWQEVATLVDSVTLKSASKNAPDTSRMKSLILDRKAVA